MLNYSLRRISLIGQFHDTFDRTRLRPLWLGEDLVGISCPVPCASAGPSLIPQLRHWKQTQERVGAIVHTALDSRGFLPQGYELPASPGRSLMGIFQDQGVWRAKPPSGISAQLTASMDDGLGLLAEKWSDIGGTPGLRPSHRWVHTTGRKSHPAEHRASTTHQVSSPCCVWVALSRHGGCGCDISELWFRDKAGGRQSAHWGDSWGLLRAGILHRDDTKLCCAIQRKKRDFVLYPDLRIRFSEINHRNTNRWLSHANTK